ncbi:hypothetical protein, partial [Sphingobium aquiterrae]|uniref:hypothetical protein n=1 Tax=Sphingobium aquiterrae TaxID=2038656 RepID=UPI0030167118
QNTVPHQAHQLFGQGSDYQAHTVFISMTSFAPQHKIHCPAATFPGWLFPGPFSLPTTQGGMTRSVALHLDRPIFHISYMFELENNLAPKMDATPIVITHDGYRPTRWSGP